MSTNRFFRKVLGGDRQMTQLQTNVEQAVAEVIRSPILNGRLIDSVALSTTVTKVEHKLGRPIRGYWVVRNNAGAVLQDNLDSESQPELYLPLIADLSCTVYLWVF